MLRQIVLARRNVARHHRRSAFSVAAVAAGVVAMLLASGFIEWSLWFGREATIHSQLGHFQVVRHAYYEQGVADPFNYLLPGTSPELDRLAGLAEVETVAPRLVFTGLVSRGEATLSFMGEGVDPEREALLSRSVRLVSGEALASSDPNGVLLGRGLAANLGVGIGDTLVLLTTLASGGVNAMEVKVRGIFGTITRAYDDSVLRMPLALAQKLNRVGGAHVWAVLLRDEAMLDQALRDADQLLARRGYDVIPWRNLADFYTKTERLFMRQLGVVKLIICLIIVLSISNTMHMAVAERTAEIGTALAMGARRRSILTLFLWEGFLVGCVGAILGLLLGITTAFAISAVGIPMPPPPGGGDAYLAEIRLTRGLAFEAVTLVLISAVFASALPAIKASRLAIVDALRRAL